MSPEVLKYKLKYNFTNKSSEVFQNEILVACQPANLAIFVELIIISEITNSEIRISSMIEFFQNSSWQICLIFCQIRQICQILLKLKIHKMY